MNDTTPLPLPEYVHHGGTCCIAGSTVPRRAAWRAFALIEDRVPNVEFLFIGASAGQQAVKSIGILCDLFEQKHRDDFIVVFQPLRYKTVITESNHEVDAQVWRAHVIDLKITRNESKNSS